MTRLRDIHGLNGAEGKHGLSVVNAIKNKLLLRVVAVVNKQEMYVENYQKVA